MAQQVRWRPILTLTKLATAIQRNMRRLFGHSFTPRSYLICTESCGDYWHYEESVSHYKSCHLGLGDASRALLVGRFA